MKSLNIFLKTCSVAAICFSVAATSSFAEEDSAFVDKLVKTAKSEKTPSGIQTALCKKASLFSAKVSFRSFSGNMCHGAIGAVALLTCKGYKDKDGPFEDSGCYKVALKSVGSDNPEAKASDILIGALKSTGKTINTVVKPLVCVGAPVLFTVTGVGAPLSAAIVSTCGAVATATNVVKGAKDAVKSSKTTTQMSTTEVEVN